MAPIRELGLKLKNDRNYLNQLTIANSLTIVRIFIITSNCIFLTTRRPLTVTTWRRFRFEQMSGYSLCSKIQRFDRPVVRNSVDLAEICKYRAKLKTTYCLRVGIACVRCGFQGCITDPMTQSESENHRIMISEKFSLEVGSKQLRIECTNPELG